MGLVATLALSSGVTYPGQPIGAVVTVYNQNAVAVRVKGIAGFLSPSGAPSRSAPGYHQGYAVGQGMPTTVPPNGSIQIPGSIVLMGSQAFESDPAGDLTPQAVEKAMIQSQIAIDAWAVVNCDDGSLTQTPVAQLRHQPMAFVAPNACVPLGIVVSAPALAGQPSLNLVSPQPGVGQARFDFASQAGLVAALVPA